MADTKPTPTQLNADALNLLLDMKLPLSISFGSTQLPLKEVMKLTIGSTVELNRMTSDPVEIIVNDCVMARGEVVVVEGNYGVRIKQIVGRGESAPEVDPASLAQLAKALEAGGRS
jgi:flagellar motor switch protein FliN